MNSDKEIRELIIRHIKRYPDMRIEDFVLLLFQNEFAGGHLIEDRAKSLNLLKRECAALPRERAGEGEAFIDIGNGLCRLDLRFLSRLGIEQETANSFFVETSNSVCGSEERFERKLELLRQMCRSGELPYSDESVEAYLLYIKAAGYGPVSHSGAYLEAYSPSYRVVKRLYRDYIDVFRSVDSILKSEGSVNLAIDGNCGAGKSALASLTAGVYDCNVFHMDDFFLRPGQRTQARLSEAGGNADYERFAAEVIEGIKSGRGFCYRRFDCKRMALGEQITVEPKRINIIEGSYSMHPKLIDMYDLKVFLKVGEEEQSRRILERSGPAMHKRFMYEWIPMENAYFKEFGIEKKSDLVYMAKED